MFARLKLGQKITFGFSIIIVIALFLGGMALVSMKTTQGGAAKLAKDYVPSVAVANNVERHSLLTMYAMRGYSLAEEEQYLEDVRKEIAEVQKYLDEAIALAAESKNLEELKKNAAEVDALVNEYETMANESIVKIEGMQTARQQILDSGDLFGTNTKAFVTSQNEEITKEIASGATKAKLQERIQKISMATNIMETGNVIRIAAWKSQAQRDPKIIETVMGNFDVITKLLDDLQKITRQEANLKQIENTRTATLAYKAALISLLENFNELQDLNTRRGEVAAKVLEGAQQTALAGMEETSGVANTANLALAAASTTMIIGLLIAVVLSVVLALVITKSITGPVNAVIETLTNGAEQVASASNQVASSSQQMAEGASEQASSLEEISSSLEEMTSMTRQNTENAKLANSGAMDAQKSAEKGSDAMTRMTDAIGKIKASSDETAKIIKTIDEIAFQTNLLALNAAVEAARAGEAGMGFAVVAEEVRNLAKRSAEAAKTTSALIEGSQRNADNGVEVTREVGSILDEIAVSARKVNQLASEVAAASDEQAQGIAQVATAVTQMDKVTQTAAANAEESASASEELSSQAAELNVAVDTLVDIVGKADDKGNGFLGKVKGTKVQHHTQISMPRKALAAPKAATRTAASSKRMTTPEDVIPLGDSFEEF